MFIFVYIAVINVISFVMYGVDKKRAKAGQWRISEKALLGVALAGGSAGSLAGMKCFRHKTRHLKFRILVPLFFIIHIILIWLFNLKLA